jgi:hypothetical protein
MKAFITISITLAMFLSPPHFLQAEDPDNFENLFHIVRSRDADEIHFQANLDKEGNLITGNPVNIFWVRQTQQNQKEPLTLVQNKYAYGLHFLEVDQQYAVFRFVSFSDKTFVLQRDNEGLFRVFTICGNREMIVDSLYIYFANDSFWFPQIQRVELHANEVYTKSLIVEYIEP